MRQTKFKQSEVVRALKAAATAGLKVERVDVDLATGKLSLQIYDAARPAPENAFDAWKAKHHAR
jgi:hypothetical protein